MERDNPGLAIYLRQKGQPIPGKPKGKFTYEPVAPVRGNE